MAKEKEFLRVCKLWDYQLLIRIVKQSTPRFTKQRSLVLIRLVLTEIQRFKNVKISKEFYGHPDAPPQSNVHEREIARGSPRLIRKTLHVAVNEDSELKLLNT